MVKWVKISDVAKRNKGMNITAGRMKELDSPEGNIRVFAGGNTIANVRYLDIEGANIIEKPSVIVKSRGNIAFEYYDKPFTHKNEMWSYEAKDGLNIKYLYYCLSVNETSFIKTAKANSVKLPQLCVADTDDFKIPLPSIEEQQRIVDILDKFEGMVENVEKELELRQSQYEYYMEQMFCSISEDGQTNLLNELCSLITDGSHSSPQNEDQGYYMPSVKDMRQNGFDFSDCKKISKESFDSLVNNGCKPRKGDVLIAKDGSMLKYCFAVEEDADYVILSSIAILRPIIMLINSKYLAYYFRRKNIREKTITEYSSKGGVPRIVLTNFKKIPVFVPSLILQQQIVAKLDKFESLIANLKRELELRKKQYEYYREKLLTFE